MRALVKTDPLYGVFVDIEWKVEDLWVGAFWKRGHNVLEIWLCLLPCLPLHITVADWWELRRNR